MQIVMPPANDAPRYARFQSLETNGFTPSVLATLLINFFRHLPIGTEHDRKQATDDFRIFINSRVNNHQRQGQKTTVVLSLKPIVYACESISSDGCHRHQCT